MAAITSILDSDNMASRASIQAVPLPHVIFAVQREMNTFSCENALLCCVLDVRIAFRTFKIRLVASF